LTLFEGLTIGLRAIQGDGEVTFGLLQLSMDTIYER